VLVFCGLICLVCTEKSDAGGLVVCLGCFSKNPDLEEGSLSKNLKRNLSCLVCLVKNDAGSLVPYIHIFGHRCLN
jgi:hypothetical protein